MARINVEQKALTDPRFAVLARLAGLADADHARGRMLHVWNACQELGAYVLDRTLVDAIFGSKGASKALVACSLAAYQTRHSVRIKGTEGRIEWLQKRREDGKRGGRRKETLGLTLGIDEKHPGNNPPAPAPAPAPAKEETTPCSPPSGDGPVVLRDWRKRAPEKRAGTSPLADPTRKAWLEEQFGKLYEFYPRHVGKDAAWRAFLKLDPDAATLKWIGRDIKRRTDAGEWLPHDEERSRFIPHLATYLNQRRWTDMEEGA